LRTCPVTKGRIHMVKTKVCIVSLGAYPLLAEQDMELVGGAELNSFRP